MIEVATPVLIEIPERRVEPLEPRPWTEDEITVGLLVDEILYLEGLVGQCNADRAWIRERQERVLSEEK